MVKILLDKWARKNKTPYRTAQEWALRGLLTSAKLVDTKVTVTRNIKKYYVDDKQQKPQ